MMIYERIYKMLDKLFQRAGYEGVTDYLTRGDYGESIDLENSPFMTLHIEKIAPGVIAMSHSYVQNGDLMRDPEMTVRCSGPDNLERCAEALTFEQSSPPIYSMAYPEPGKVNIKIKKDINQFLLQWLNNLQDQGF